MHTHFNFELGAQELASLAKWLQTDAAAERQKQAGRVGVKVFFLCGITMMTSIPQKWFFNREKDDKQSGFRGTLFFDKPTCSSNLERIRFDKFLDELGCLIIRSCTFCYYR